MTGDRSEAELSALLATLIREVAEVDIGPDANFFEAGLTSALLLGLHRRLNAALAVDLPVSALFRDPTRRSLARRLAQGAPATPTAGPSGRPPGTGAASSRSIVDARRALRNRIRGVSR
jgi:hypothetical protein